MLTLLLADSELETVPPSLVGHHATAATARGKGRATKRTLLNASRHHHAMGEVDLAEAERRGRPDIVHGFLMTALDSALNLEGGLRVRVHTRHDELITVDPRTRIMRDQERFYGLVEQLFERSEVGPRGGDPLMTRAENVNLRQAIAFEQPDHVIALSPAGDPADPWEALGPIAEAHDHVLVVLGGFPKGTYKSPIQELSDETWSIHPDPLTVWAATSEVIVPWRKVSSGVQAHRGPVPEGR